MKLGGRAFLVPEVLQSSSMDCGPAALQAVLAGFGLTADYEALRARCRADVDGTSLDALASLGRELGLETERVLVPRDHFCLPEARMLPAIVVTRANGGPLHFVVAWRALGPFVQVLDPGSGRRWVRSEALLRAVAEFPISICSRRFRAWAGSESAARPLRARLSALGVSEVHARELLARAAADASWCSFATLDAAIRFVAALVHGRALSRGRAAGRLLEEVLRPEPAAGAGERVPPRFFWATERGAPPGQLCVRGCVVVCFARGSSSPARPAEPPRPAVVGATLSRSEVEAAPLRALWALVRADAGVSLALIGAALLTQAGLVPLEAVLFRALLGVGRDLTLGYQRLLSAGLVLLLLVLGLGLEAKCAQALRQLGRRLAVRLHVELLGKLPRLPDEYLLSRPASDMAARGHTLHLLRELPGTWAQAARALCTLVATSLGLVWLEPGAAPLTLALVGLGLAVPRLSRRTLAEATVRLRVHSTSLERIRLDALLGACPARVHAAEGSIALEHEERLCEWSRTASALGRDQARILTLQAVSGAAIVTTLVAGYVLRGGEVALLPLLVYWALRVPASAGELVVAEQNVRSLRAVLTRLLAPLSIEGRDPPQGTPDAPAAPRAERAAGVELSLNDVSVEAGGHRLLHELRLSIGPGSHVAIVGASGSGKSSLLGLLLGWLRPCAGVLRVDGRELGGPRSGDSTLWALREQTAWVDPGAQIWARSVYDNVTYGDLEDVVERLPIALERADLLEVLEGLPDGLASPVGEAGAGLSGGQGQRLRLARALMRPGARLVLLDEPFRGLERERRRVLLGRVRAHWPEATLLFVSHDIEDTLDFERVLVLEAGRVVEDGAPAQLRERPASRYAALLDAARELDAVFSPARGWQRRRLVGGRLEQEAS